MMASRKTATKKAKVYALLVGINQYLGGVPRLNGCVNDVRQMAEFLQERTRGSDYELALKVLTSGDPENPEEIKPTRQAVIDAFRSHLGQAGPGDTAFFYYSGHGSQEKAPPQFWHIEPDHLDETLVCYDSRTDDGWDLADKELAVLIHEVAEKQPHLLVILDACHSGSGTRAAEGTGVRLAPTDLRDRPLDSFLPEVIPTVERLANRPKEQPDAKAADWFTLPQGRHVVISACRAEESAREKVMENGQLHGVLSYYLMDTLRQVGPTLTYRDVFSRVDTLVRNVVRDQNPVVAATDTDDLLQPFLGGAIAEQMPYYHLAHEKEAGWVIKAGAIHGIAQPLNGETTHLAVFPLNATVSIGSSLEGAIGRAQVTEVGGNQSRVTLTMNDGSEPDPMQTYKAVVVATPLAPVPVYLSGDDDTALAALREALQSSLIVLVVEAAEEALIRVTANQTDDHYRLQRAGDRQPLTVEAPGKGTSAGVLAARSKVEHIARWMQVLQLENKQSQLPPDAVRMEFFRYIPGDGGAPDRSEPLAGETDVRLAYDLEKGEKAALWQIKLTHTGKVDYPLFCMLVDLTEDFAIATDTALFGGGVWLHPNQEEWAKVSDANKFIYAYVPKELREKGITQLQDVIKLIVSTDASDATLLKQGGLEVVKDEATRGTEAPKAAVPASTLNRLMRRVQTRAVGSLPEEAAKLSDWRTVQATVTIVAEGKGVEVPQQAGQKATLAEGVTVQAHSALQAKAKLTRFDEGKRDIGNLALPAVFRDHPELAQPFDFRPARGGDAGESVIVLSDVANREAVTPEAPLKIQVDGRMAEDESILAVGYDPESELFLPLGSGVQAGNRIEIRIDRLPEPTADTRDLKGSIKLFFQKVVAEKIGAEKLGLDGRTHRLAAAMVDEQDRIVYDDSPITLKEKVQQAERILLFIHGFTGDTRGMVRCAYGLKTPTAETLTKLADCYDLLMAYDYENINTSIELTAQKLKADLAGVGLGPDHGKTLHIVAHSMGTMVTRCFIEREGGNRVVEKAVLVGPPNAGTPWAKIQDYLVLGLGAALNGLAALAWPPGAIPILIGGLTTLVGGVEKVDVALDELKPNSDFYKKLNASDDPRVEYVIIAGNTSKITYSQPESAEAEKQVLQKLVQRLTSAETRNRILSLAFFNEPNDMAISVKSMTAIPANRNPEPALVEAECDHISYFNTEVGLRKVVNALTG